MAVRLLVVVTEQDLPYQALSAYNRNCVDEIFQEEQSHPPGRWQTGSGN